MGRKNMRSSVLGLLFLGSSSIFFVLFVSFFYVEKHAFPSPSLQ